MKISALASASHAEAEQIAADGSSLGVNGSLPRTSQMQGCIIPKLPLVAQERQ